MRKKRSPKKATRPVDVYQLFKDEPRMEPSKIEDVPDWFVEMAEKFNNGTLFKQTEEYSPYDGHIYWRRKRRDLIKTVKTHLHNSNQQERKKKVNVSEGGNKRREQRHEQSTSTTKAPHHEYNMKHRESAVQSTKTPQSGH